MNKVLKKSLGFTVPVLYYSSFEEADKVAGKAGAMLEEANNNLYYRGVAEECRTHVAAAVEELTGVAREYRPVMKTTKDDKGVETKTEAKDSDGNIITEPVLSDDDYVKAALAKSGKTVEQLNPAVTKYIEDLKDEKTGQPAPIAVDISRTERKAPQPKKLPTKFLESATKAIASGKVASFAKEYEKLLKVKLPEEATKDATKLGWCIKAFFAAREQATLEAIAA